MGSQWQCSATNPWLWRYTGCGCERHTYAILVIHLLISGLFVPPDFNCSAQLNERFVVPFFYPSTSSFVPTTSMIQADSASLSITVGVYYTNPALSLNRSLLLELS